MDAVMKPSRKGGRRLLRDADIMRWQPKQSSYLIVATGRSTEFRTSPRQPRHRSSPSSRDPNNHRPSTPRRCAAAPVTDRMASPADKGEDPWNDNTKEKFNRLVTTPRFFLGFPVSDLLPLPHSSKSKSKWLDPCQEAASKSIKCLNRNGGDRAMCQDYFECVPHEQAGLVDWAGLGRRQQG